MHGTPATAALAASPTSNTASVCHLDVGAAVHPPSQSDAAAAASLLQAMAAYNRSLGGQAVSVACMPSAHHNLTAGASNFTPAYDSPQPGYHPAYARSRWLPPASTLQPAFEPSALSVLPVDAAPTDTGCLTADEIYEMGMIEASLKEWWERQQLAVRCREDLVRIREAEMAAESGRGNVEVGDEWDWQRKAQDPTVEKRSELHLRANECEQHLREYKQFRAAMLPRVRRLSARIQQLQQKEFKGT